MKLESSIKVRTNVKMTDNKRSGTRRVYIDVHDVIRVI